MQMRFSLSVRCLVALLCAANAFLVALPASAELAPQYLPDGRYYAKSRLLVRTRVGLSEVEVDSVLKGHAGKRRGRIERLGVHVIELPAQVNEIAVAKALRNNPHFEAVELDYAYEPELTVNDPHYSNAWHLPKMAVPTAWDYTQSPGPTIAILDSGVNAAHPDLAAQMVPGWNFYNNNSDTSDVYGHGTKVAGAAAAAGNNGIGVVGVSWRSKIMPIRVTDTAGYGYSSAIANGIVWAADRGARVVNLSFRNVAGDSMIINAANYMRSKGGVVVAAGGNTGNELVLPASSSITAVAATNSADSRTSWSSWGNHIDVAAPGEGIWTTTSSGGYGGSSGTSFSSPVTAGVYALMMTANPALSPAELDDILFTTTVDINAPGWDVYTGHGRVNAAAAVQKAFSAGSADQQAPTASITSPTGGTLSGTVAVHVSATDNTAVTRVDLLVDGKVVLSDASAPYAFSWNTTTVANGSRTLQAKAYDAAGNVGTSSSRSVTVSNDKTAPTVSISSPAAGSTLSGTVSVSMSASDNKAVTRVDLLVDGKVVASDTTSPYAISWNTATVANGSRTLQAKAYDAAGNVGTSASRSVTVSNDKTAPTVSISNPAAGSTLSGTVSVNMSASDNKAVTRVDLLVDGKVVGSDTTSPYAISWNTTTVANGSHTLQAKAYDAAGNVGSSSSVSVKVAGAAATGDTTAPSVSIISPTNGSTVSGVVRISLSASDNVGVTKLTLLIDGVLIASMNNYGALMYDWRVPAGNGTLTSTVMARAEDKAGNVTTRSITVKR